MIEEREEKLKEGARGQSVWGKIAVSESTTMRGNCKKIDLKRL